MDNAELRTLGTAFKAMRLHRGLTQAQLALRAGLPRIKVIQAEHGVASVSAGAYAAIATALGAALGLVPVRRPTLEEARELFRDR